MAMIDVSRQRRSLLEDATVLELLPAEILAIIQTESSTKLLDAIAEAALCPPLTERIFAHFEHVFPDVCARWILNPGNEQKHIRIYSALARILPFAPYLSTFIEYASSTAEQPTNSHSLRLPPLKLDQDAITQDGDVLLQSLLTLFNHQNWKLESLIQEHIGKSEAILADFDGRSIDYGFLSLYEQSRVKSFLTLRQEALTPYVVSYGNPSNLVLTPTTVSNLEKLATMLREHDPVMLHGPPGVGKTALVHEIAKQLGMYSNMMLIGLYSTDTKPGSFQWRPGVLTTAVKEGRWVLVEDLDRAPTEVLSTRGERILRTSRGVNGRENLPSMVALAASELEDVIVQTYPILRRLVPDILAVYARLSQFSNKPGAFTRGRNVMDRQMTLRSKTGEEAITNTTEDQICPDPQIGKDLIFAIAEEMRIPKERESENQFSIGRAKSKRPFASTAHAKRLLEQIAVAVKLNEAVLLVGETGIGKTTVLVAVNLSQQSEVGDLLGGFKPEEFEDLFSATGISASKNQKYLEQVGKCFAKGQWSRMFNKITRDGDEQPTKRRKTQSKLQILLDLRPRWDLFARNLEHFAFSFMEGNLVKAVRNGDWERPSILLIFVGIRSRFTEVYTYLGNSSSKNDQAADDIAQEKRLVDGANEVPHFSLRTLTRVLSYVNTIAPYYGVRRALYEGFAMGFLTLLDRESEKMLSHGNPQSLLSQAPKHPNDGKQYGNETPIERDDYIITPYVERNLLNLVRPTSAGKTSMIEYLANFTGNKFEYLEGILVQAMRQGHWIVLDELNLAPTDLLIPETQEINPPGLYGGRKVLSRAFHELEFILQQRSRNTSPPDCRRIVTVYKELFATLRDLFRWALREAETREEIACHGFMLLAERVLKIDPQNLYSATVAPELKQFTTLRNNEPVLLLHIVNAHQNTETGDLIGSQRPIHISGSVEERLERYNTLDTSIINNIPQDVRERINGSLVESMREGHFFLLDEISLADDSVLERLNSGVDNSFVKELSPALRNRFTEIWVPALSQSEDIYEIQLTEIIVKFAAWFGDTFREILVWVQFINNFQSNEPIISLSLGQQRQKCLGKLSELIELSMDDHSLTIGHFSIPRASIGVADPGFAFHAPTTRLNAMRGSPGVACGQPLTRINLSDQTDLMDLFGTDVPVEGAEAGNFAWRDAPFLQAMQKGEWSVLEGLNACLDHRVFKRHPDFRLFAAQNPHHQGGGRKDDDLNLIAAHNYPKIEPQAISQLIQFAFGSQGSPWEFNLRDVLRWLKLLDSSDPLLRNAHVDDFLDIIVRQRFRTQRDREEVDNIFTLYHDINPIHPHSQPERLPNIDIIPRLAELESLMICVKQNTVLLEHVAALAGKPLVVFPMNADIDTMDLVGGFEQADPLREDLQNLVMSTVPGDVPNQALYLLHLLDGFTAAKGLLQEIPTDSEVATALSKALVPLQQNLVLENPRFEWLDGVIVKALQMGQWLVLDNANMCNASPNGFLSINEHCGPGGEPRILSRAMRNRAVEIHIHTPPPALDPSYNRVQIVERALETLSISDIALLPRFADTLPKDTANKEANGTDGFKTVSNLYDSLNVPALKPTQPLHPLSNFPMAQILPSTDHARWLGACLEFYHDLYRLQNSIEGQRRQAQVNKLNALNRLQRSLVSDRVAAVSKDATVKLASFLVSTINTTKEWLGFNFESSESWTERVRILKGVVRYLERTVRLTTEDNFDEAKFQAHLAQGTNFLEKQLTLSNGIQEREFVLLLLDRLGKDFTAGFKLSTGLSMELLWHVFRPTPLPTKILLDQTLELEKLGSRFDTLRWKAGAAIPDLAKAMTTLEKASGIISSDVPNVDSLLESLTTEIESLESRIGADEAERMPFMVEEFESLRQVAMLSPTNSDHAELQVLSNIPTQAGIMLASSEHQAALLQTVENLVFQNQFSWDGKFVTSFWSKLQNLGSVNLGSLALLEAELPIAGRQLATLSADLVQNPLIRLNNVLSNLLFEVFNAHGQGLKQVVVEAAQLVSQDPAANSQAFDAILPLIEQDHFRQIAVEHLIPALKALTASQVDLQKQAHLSAFAWIHFSIGTVKLYVPDRVFDPQSRPKMEREFLQEMHALLDQRTGSLRTFEKLFTGQDTNERIRLLEAEATALGPLPEEVRPIYRPDQSELSRLHAEFSNVLKAVTGPTLSSALQILENDPGQAAEELHLVKENVLRLLDRLSARFEAYQDMTRPTSSLLRCLMIGLSLCDAASARNLAPASQQILEVTPFLGGTMWNQKDGDFSSRTFEFLNYMSVVASIEGFENIGHHARDMVFKSFHSLFDEWTKRLEADRKEQAAKGSLYRFRGSLEDEEEIDTEEFNELFPTFDDEEAANVPSAKKQDEVRDRSLHVAQIHKNLFLTQQDFATAINDVCKSVGDRVTSETIDHKNIDRNLTSKMLAGTMFFLNDKLESLVSPTVDKDYNFYTDANVPEARQLVVLMHKIKARFRELQMVDEIGHMQPLADVIQACDQVLELVHTEPLAKILPKVEYLHGHVYEWQFGGWASKIYVIRWRRLELSTWANLFDMEQKKCQDDAYSWWFVAYQVVIAVPLSLVDFPKEMTKYAASLISSLEMYFSTAIVGQYGARLALLHYPILQVVLHSLSNFIHYYSRYEKIMEETLHKGRLPIEKKMKDVLLMASWKDTNINALRESARKKFREQGLPDEEVCRMAHLDNKSPAPEVSADVFSKLNETMPGWIDGHRRLANVSKTVSVMRKISDNPDMSSDVPQTIDDYLRKETPPFLNDENKDQVKHLKTRKRKLFADTLRDLRQMGLKHNLGQDKLAEQETLSLVLASIKPAMDYHFHKILDLVPKDLTSAEIARSRSLISNGGSSLSLLKRSSSQFHHLSLAQEHGALLRQTTVSDWTRLLPWLVQILQYAIRLHTMTLEHLKSWNGRFESLQTSTTGLKQFPEGVSSEAAALAEAKFSSELSSFRASLEDLNREHPKLSFEVLGLTYNGKELGTFANAISTLCDKILEDEPEVERSDQHLGQAAMSLMAIASPILTEYVGLSQQTLMQTFTQISSQGFCTPQEKSDETSGESSKDIQPDEDLSELAQEANKEENGEMEDEKDAVDMADEELEGDMGSNGDEEEEEENDMDEEAGDVDDLDPTAADKDQQGEKAKGQKKDDEQLAGDEDAQKQDGEEQPDVDDSGEQDAEEEEEAGAEEEDQTAQENDTLALPEDMDLDLGDEQEPASDKEKKEVEDQEMGDDADQDSEDAAAEAQLQEEAGEEAGIEEDEETPEEKAGEEEEKAEEQEDATDQSQPPQDSATTDTDNAAPSDVKTSGQDQNADSMDEDGEMGEGAADQDTSAGNKADQEQDKPDSARSDPFKKLGDALERWHRQQEDIKDAEPSEANEQNAPQDPSADQAMGTADDEQQDPTSRLMDEDKDETEQDPDKMDTADTTEAPDDDTRSGVKTRQEEDQDESMQQWTEFQTKTHSLSLALTSQLRLILTPSQSTKLSGGFRTGKRLSIKHKIWMRRSIPTKRTYQILLCVDDSKTGQVEPFASDAGAKARQQGSAHEGIRRMLREAMEERIMIKKGDSVLELKEAKFVRDGGESKVYYLIVHNLEELPSALAGLLRTWFAEVNA
ncbi:hypothetical protein EDB82DRAFT_546712 [Fusarium venenatum]|uniref:uncharacterized protein n=1 Tax=Fusarium venenatum TaxID=56646 RepID=UPI001DEC07CE|nr:hypothetical protein EDB82DRAFT_546712 [Fusarium venenatum]